MAGFIYRRTPVSSFISLKARNVRLCSSMNIKEKTGNSESMVKRKLSELLQWYEEVTGMSEVRIAQNRVLEAEQKFITSQERRRETNKLVSDIQCKLKDLYAELDNTTRGEERYVHLITEEHKVLKEERRAVEEFQRYEREERDYFAVLSSAVKESHEKERAQAERTKYWSIIGSIIGTILGIVGSSVNNELKMRELRRLMKESLGKYEVNNLSMPETLSKHEKEISDILNELKTILSLPSDKFLGRVNTLNNKMDTDKLITSPETSFEVTRSLKQLESDIDRHFVELKSVIQNKVEIGDQLLTVLPFDLEEKFQQQEKRQLILTCCTVISFTIPLFCKYFGLL